MAGTAESFRTLMVMRAADVTWVREMDLPTPPAPGLGIRVDVYDMLNVVAVTIGDPGYDATCLVEFETPPPAGAVAEKCAAYGFAEGAYPPPPPGSARPEPGDPETEAAPLRAALVFAGDGTWLREYGLPFPPFPGLRIRLGSELLLNVFSVVVGDPHGDVTCLVAFEGEGGGELSEEDYPSLGFEECLYP
ncbi:hypothetical protein HS041_00200 [Planomonospora sp. ID67723]|uniref:hypothetical protein n=1 Tax=Planomonospora sp. ID67723 TaxID=2738134 RepID=UPI0018C3FC36|nr:hypothetical protein [Planomonospora sp. ID67723]MBG0826206.1 hypothetical protein [Planomonospora sp. ID67723]